MRKTKKIRKFIISILPIDTDGRKMFEEFGWYNPNLPTLKSIFQKDAIVLLDKGKGHGSPEDWIELLKQDHPSWQMSYVYR